MRWFWPICNIAVKLALVGLIIHSLVAGDLEQFQDKAMRARQLLFPLSMLLVPAWWLATGRRHPYPHALDTLIVLPFVIDLCGNATDFYNTYEYFDDFVHTLNPVIFVLAAMLVIAMTGIPIWAAALIAFGLGSTGHIIFEVIEYWLFTGGNSRLNLSLADTLSDLSWGLVGSAIGVAIGAAIVMAERRASRRS